MALEDRSIDLVRRPSGCVEAVELSPSWRPHTIANKSPPTPFMFGSTKPSMALTATAASTALPPALRMSIPTCAASGWLAATMPVGAMVSDRLECGLRAGRLYP